MSFQRRAIRVGIGCVTAAVVTAAGLHAQSAPPKPGQPKTTPAATPAPVAVDPPPADYVIGVDDQLTVNFWRD